MQFRDAALIAKHIGGYVKLKKSGWTHEYVQFYWDGDKLMSSRGGLYPVDASGVKDSKLPGFYVFKEWKDPLPMTPAEIKQVLDEMQEQE